MLYGQINIDKIERDMNAINKPGNVPEHHKKEIRLLRPYFREIKSLVDNVDAINVTMYGKFPKPKKPGQGKIRTLEPLELIP
jgi:hypothetical protein